MSARYRVAESRNRLRIEAIIDLSLWYRLSVAVFAGACLTLLLNQALRSWWWLLVSIAVGGVVFASYRTRRTSLDATKYEFATSGSVGGRGRRLPAVVFTSSISELKFDAGSYVTGNHSDGLYAVTGSTQVLLLPDLDFNQTMEIVAKIEQKFPGLAEMWREKRTTNRNQSER